MPDAALPLAAVIITEGSVLGTRGLGDASPAACWVSSLIPILQGGQETPEVTEPVKGPSESKLFQQSQTRGSNALPVTFLVTLAMQAASLNCQVLTRETSSSISDPSPSLTAPKNTHPQGTQGRHAAQGTRPSLFQKVLRQGHSLRGRLRNGPWRAEGVWPWFL